MGIEDSVKKLLVSAGRRVLLKDIWDERTEAQKYINDSGFEEKSKSIQKVGSSVRFGARAAIRGGGDFLAMADLYRITEDPQNALYYVMGAVGALVVFYGFDHWFYDRVSPNPYRDIETQNKR